MFTHFLYAAKDFAVRNKLKNSLHTLAVCGEAQKVIGGLVHQKIPAVSYRGKILYVKTNRFSLANEIKLKEQDIKNELKKRGIVVGAVRCAA